MKHSSFFQASPNILEVILKHDVGNFPSEEKLYEALLRWATYEENINPSVYDDNSDQASTESFENLSSAALQENPTFPDPSTFEYDFSILRNPVFSKPTSPILMRSDEEGVVRRHSIGTVGQRKRQKEDNASKRRDSADSDSFPSFRLMLLPYLLQHIRFPLMTPQYLTSNIIPNETVMNAEGMKDLVSAGSFLGWFLLKTDKALSVADLYPFFTLAHRSICIPCGRHTKQFKPIAISNACAKS
jgi:hypothetical protein